METMLIVVQNDKDHTQAKVLIERLMESSRREDRARLAAQARLVEAYEQARWPRRAASLPELLAYLLEEHSLTRADLAPLLGGANRVSEVLRGKRPLSMSMVRRLRDRFNISADLLIQPLPKSRAPLAA